MDIIGLVLYSVARTMAVVMIPEENVFRVFNRESMIVFAVMRHEVNTDREEPVDAHHGLVHDPDQRLSRFTK